VSIDHVVSLGDVFISSLFLVYSNVLMKSNL